MGDSKENDSVVPEWQKAAATQDSEPSSKSTTVPSEPAATMEQARKFLQDDEVQRYPRDKKIDFLKSKGLSDTDIEQLITEETSGAQISSPPTSQPSDDQKPLVSDPAVLKTPPQTMPTPPSPDSSPPSTPDHQPVSDPPVLKTPPQTMPSPPSPDSTTTTDRPPIVTYPEFLTKPVRPPPLITVNRFLTTLYGFAGLSSVLYGTSKYILAPMVDSLTEARIDLHDQAKHDLTRLVDKLESVVSEIPPTVGAIKHDGSYRDDLSSTSEYDDPTELFHRDIGVQTSPPLSPTLSNSRNTPAPNSSSSTPLDSQTHTLSRLTSSVRELVTSHDSQKEDWDDIGAVLGVFKDELEKMSYPRHDFVSGGGGSNIYGYNREPDDEIRKMKEGIRRVKGVLLSARSFPAGR